MSNISRVKISALGKTITGKTPSSNNPEDFGSDYMFVTPSDSFDKKMMNLTERYLSEEGVQKLSSKLLPPNSIMVTCIGSAMGKVSMNETSCVTNQQINSIVPNNNFDPHYIYYTIKNNYKVLRNAATGSTAVPLLNKTDFDILELLIHKDLPTQKSIAKVLSDLDAKIELNNRINRELEAMAKTLYDYWFVQFDFPVRTLSGVEGYKSSGGKMVYNAELKREIPEGWAVKQINTKVKIGSGFPFNSDDYSDTGKYKIITIKNVQEGYLETSSVDYVSFLPNNISDFCILKEGDILMSLTGNVGRMCFVDQSNLLLNQRVGKLLGEKDFVTYAYFFFKRPENQKRLEKIAGGSSQANLSPIDAVKDKFPIPTAPVLNNFTQLVNPLLNQILIKNQENQHLTALRDWLLPMLMNGQVRVKEAEERLSMAAEPSVEYKKG